MSSREAAMRRLLCLLCLLFAIPAMAQYPEVDAAVDALMAKDLPALSKHLPPSLQQGISELPAVRQKELNETFVPSRSLLREGAIVKRSDSPDALVIIEAIDPKASNRPPLTITLNKRVSDGAESILRFALHSGEDNSEPFQVWMKFVDSEWRIYELQDPSGRRRVDLDAPEFLAQVRQTPQNSNEASAVGSMRSYNTAAVTYASSYPDIGWPEKAEYFGVPQPGAEPDAQHTGLLDPTLTTPPFEKLGYRFTYKKSGENYSVIARPVKFGETGSKNFFTDQSGVIRSTDKDEEPTVNDPPLQ
jgi:type IV pilus assembly protein PilA